MSIKSEKAKADVELLQRQLRWCELSDVRFGIEDHKESRAYKIGKDIESYVIQAESDARERAVRAHAKECKYLVATKCILSEFHTECDLIPHCTDKQQFLKNYDNE